MTRNADIGEETKLRVRLTTAYGAIVSIVATTIWLTALLLKLHVGNQHEHSRLLSELSTINTRSEEWVTQYQLESALAFVITEAHRGMTNVTIKDFELRKGIREVIRSPKDNLP